MPAAASLARMASAICCSPAPPGASDGFTELTATRSRSSSIVRCTFTSQVPRCYHACMSPDGSTAGVDSSLRLAHEIAREVAGAGGRALVVGGWARDALLGRPSKDIDLEVFNLSADRLRELLHTFGPVQTVGESFTVYKVGP